MNSADNDFVLYHLVLRLVWHLLSAYNFWGGTGVACRLTVLPFEVEYVVLDRGKRVVVGDVEACSLLSSVT